MRDLKDFTEEARASWLQLRPSDDMTGFELSMRIRRLGAILGDRVDEVVRSYGFKMFGDYEVAASIRREDRPLRPSEIAEHLMITRAGITGRLNRLEDMALVMRTNAEDDARSVLVLLTAAGRSSVDGAFDALSGDRAEIFSPLSESQQHDVSDLLRRLLVPIDPARRSRD